MFTLTGHSMTRSNLRRSLLMALACLGATCFAYQSQAHAHGDVFHIFSPVIEKGGWGVETLTAYQTGLPSGEDADKVNFASEFAAHADITDYWMGKISFNTVHEAGVEYKLDTVSFENVLRADKWSLRNFDAAFYSAMFVATDGAATNAFVFGPVLSYFNGPAAIILNPFFEKTFGQNKEEGLALSYAWRATYQIQKKFSLGVEGYGEIENLGNIPATHDQVHRVGPVLYFGQVHGNPHDHPSLKHHDHSPGQEHQSPNDIEHHNDVGALSADVGVLFGLTENTSDTALKANVYMHF